MKEDTNFNGGLGAYSDVGEADMFGLDEFGNPLGMSAGVGAAIGGGVSTVVAIGTRLVAKNSVGAYKWSEGIGALVGALAGGLMMVSEKTRHAGWAALGVSLITGGLRQLEMFLGTTPGETASVATDAAKAAASGTPSTWGETVMHTTGIVPAGLGIATIAPTGVVAPGLGDSGPEILGNSPAQQRTRQAQLVGVPTIGGPLAGLASSFGATVMG